MEGKWPSGEKVARRGLLARVGSQAQALFSPAAAAPAARPRVSSSVAIHKLRESKWFLRREQNVLCAVLESGFIVEVRAEDDAPDPDADAQDARVPRDYHAFGIALWKKGKEKTKDPEQVEVYTLQQKGNRKRVCKMSLENFWKPGTTIRINNVEDKQESVNAEKDIRAKLDMAAKSRYERNWHNTLHFVHWIRYGETPGEARSRQMSETLKWGSVGMNMGVLLIMNNGGRRQQLTSI